jgi:hypothetical protein
VKNKDNLEWQKRMNPWGAQPNETPAQRDKRFLNIDVKLCQGCHNEDNDVTWKPDARTHRPAVEKKWPPIAH